MNKLKLGIPKGSMQHSTVELFRKAGYNITIKGRSYYPQIDDDEISIMLLRPQEMALYVNRGVIDLGLAGLDWVRECQTELLELAELTYSKQTNRPARWVLAVAENCDIRSVEELENKIIFTELVETTKSYLSEKGVNATVKFSHGATEIKIPHLCDAIVELTETGSSLKANNLRILDTVMESVTTLIVNQESWKNPWKRTKIENIKMLLTGALEANGKVGLKMNVSGENLDRLLEMLPSMRNPTISSLTQQNGNLAKWHAVEIIAEENIVRSLIPELRRAGAVDIVEYPLNKVIP